MPIPDGPRGANGLADLSALAPDDIWTVGSGWDAGGIEPIALRWNGTSWREVPIPDLRTPFVDGRLLDPGDWLGGVAALSPTKVWAAGGRLFWEPSNGGWSSREEALLLRWNGRAWKVVSSPVPGTDSWLADVARVPGTARSWAVGSIQRGALSQPLILRHC